LWNSGTILLLLTGVGSALFFAKKKAGAKLLALWFFVVVLLFGFYRKGIFDYYFGIFFALPFLLTGLVLSTLSTYGKFWKAISFAVLIGLLYFNWLGRPFLFPPNKQLSQTKEISKVVFDQAKGMPFNFALITRNNSDHAYRYFFEIWGNSPVTIENEAIDPQRKTVADQLLIICDLYHTDCQPLGHPLWEIAGFGRAEIVGTWTVPFVTIFKLEHYKQ